MSDTPRTDAAMFCIGCGHDGNGSPQDVVDAESCRELERELNAATARDAALREAVANLRQLNREHDEAAQIYKVKRGDTMFATEEANAALTNLDNCAGKCMRAEAGLIEMLLEKY